jgi:phosphoenolpyruvate synthase/pyruvate phosphate dikinase
VRQFLKDIDAWDLMIQLDQVDRSNEIKKLTDEIKSRIEQAEFPKELHEKIKGSLKERDFSSIIIRSSTGVEDRPEASFAGGYISSDEIELADDLEESMAKVEEAIKKTVASYFSTESVEVVKGMEKRLIDIEWAVGIQEFKRADFGGVISSSRDKIIFEINESPDLVVQGLNQLRVIFNRQTEEITREGNMIEQISDNFIIVFASFVKSLEKTTNERQNIEFLLRLDELDLLQRRA